MKPVKFHRKALEELERARSWYSGKNTKLSIQFFTEVSEAVGSIRKIPSVWPKYFGNYQRIILKRFPYFLVYRETESIIRLLAVVHAKRKPGYWLERK